MSQWCIECWGSFKQRTPATHVIDDDPYCDGCVQRLGLDDGFVEIDHPIASPPPPVDRNAGPVPMEYRAPIKAAKKEYPNDSPSGSEPGTLNGTRPHTHERQEIAAREPVATPVQPQQFLKGESVEKRKCSKCGVDIRLNSKTGQCTPCNQGLRADHPLRKKNEAAAAPRSNIEPKKKVKPKKRTVPQHLPPAAAKPVVSVMIELHEEQLDNIWARLSVAEKGEMVSALLTAEPAAVSV